MTGFRVARGGAADRYGVTPGPRHARQDRRRRRAAGRLRRPCVADAAGGAGRARLPGRHLRGASAGGGGRTRHARRHRRARRTSTTRSRRAAPGCSRASQDAAARPAWRCRSSASARCGRCSSRPRPVASWDDAAAVDREAFARVLPRDAGARRAAAAVGVRVGVPLGGARRRRSSTRRSPRPRPPSREARA